MDSQGVDNKNIIILAIQPTNLSQIYRNSIILVVIKGVIPLPSHQILGAEGKLLQICRFEKGIDPLQLLLTSTCLACTILHPETTKQLIACLVDACSSTTQRLRLKDLLPMMTDLILSITSGIVRQCSGFDALWLQLLLIRSYKSQEERELRQDFIFQKIDNYIKIYFYKFSYSHSSGFIFLTTIVKYLICLQTMFDSCKQLISYNEKKWINAHEIDIVTGKTILPRTILFACEDIMSEKNHQNLASLLYSLHNSKEELGITQMMVAFENIIVPLITKILAVDRFQQFMQTPALLYQLLSEIVQEKFDPDDFLMTLSKMVKLFISKSPDFFLYLFQMFRYSLQKRLKCEQEEVWEPPEYLLNSKPLELISVFYLMAVIPYQSEISPHIFSYLRVVITPSFVQQLNCMQIALFYFFLEQAYLQLYDQRLEEGNFLLMYVFKESMDPSSKYFLYEFIYRLSEYYIDAKYILIYVQQLPRMYDYQNKWDNVSNWIANLQDFGEVFAIELVTIIKDHIRNEIRLSVEDKQEITFHYKQLRKYFELLDQIAKNKKIIKKKTQLQLLLLQEYANAQSITDLDIEDILLASLLPFFRIHEKLYNSILKVLIKRHSQNRFKASTNFYFLLAEYIYHTRDTGVLLYIYEYIGQTIDHIYMVVRMEEGKRGDFLVNIANILILFQNLLLVHPKVMKRHAIQRMAAKVLAIEGFVVSQASCMNQKAELWTIYARCLNIELAIFCLLSCEMPLQAKYFLEVKRGIHKKYDSQFLVETLEMLNPITSPKNRSCILYIILDILKDLRQEKETEDSDTEKYEKLFQLPNKMTPVFNKCRSVFQQIKKLMFFYRVPNWNNIHTYAQTMSFGFIFELKREFESMQIIEDKGPQYMKRRQKVRNEDEDEDHQTTRTMYETFTKRLKRDAEMLPNDVPELVLSSGSSQRQLQIDQKTINENIRHLQEEKFEANEADEAVEQLINQSKQYFEQTNTQSVFFSCLSDCA